MLHGRTFEIAASIGAVSAAAQGLAVAIGAATSDAPPDLGAWISAGGSFSAAGALIYIVKKMTDGQLVARDPGRVEATQAEQLARHQELLRDALDREEKLEHLYREAINRGPRP